MPTRRRSEVKYLTLSIASIATCQLAGLLRFGSTHCYPRFLNFRDSVTVSQGARQVCILPQKLAAQRIFQVVAALNTVENAAKYDLIVFDSKRDSVLFFPRTSAINEKVIVLGVI